jgi:nicotinamide mononucleotide transporter
VIEALLRALADIGPVEAVGVVLGYAYVLLIYRGNRLGWVAGGISSVAYVYLAARSHLPMQSTLNVYYVLMSVYGWIHWTRSARQDALQLSRWPLRRHGIAILAIVLTSALVSRLLQRETQAAWPFLDSLATCTSLFATWLVSRLKLENWLYWIGADCVTAFMFGAQGHAPSALMYGSYTLIAAFGFRAWLRRYRLQAASRE